MTSGWTGGQYSIYRALLACAIACLFGERFLGSPISALSAVLMFAGLALCTALAIGWHDRIAALLLWSAGASLVAIFDAKSLVLPSQEAIVFSALLLLHAATPANPYGSFRARGRPDPAGDWGMPSWIQHLAWALLALLYTTQDLQEASGAGLHWGPVDLRMLAALGLVFDLGFAIAVFRVHWRASAWIAMSLWKLAEFFAFGPVYGGADIWLLQLLAVDPGWFPGRRSAVAESDDASLRAASARLFYDGECGLCHRTVRFLLAEESGMPADARLRFAPIGSQAFTDLLAKHPKLDPSELPDSIILELEDGRILSRSRAALEIANRLGGFWRMLAIVLSVGTIGRNAGFGGSFPYSTLDIAYDAIARVRKTIFAQPKDSCPILPPDLRARFDL